MADVFISYSRRDSDYVRQLQKELQERGKDVWVDIEGIRDAEVFPLALRRAIEGSDAFVFVISPDSVRSPFCEQEVAHASELNKRIVPVALHEVPDGEIPDEVRFRNWIPAGHNGDLDTSVERLLTAIDTDLAWEHQHTRLTVKALEWDQAGRDKSFLLRGSELAAAEQWLAAGADKDPGPSTLEQEYLLAARSAASRRQRLLVGASLAVALVSVGLLVFALISRSQAISTSKTAKSRALAADSQTQLSIDPERSILLASAAVRTKATPEALFALRGALDASPIRFRLPDAERQECSSAGASNSIQGVLAPGVAFGAGGRQLAEGLCNGSVVLADGTTGTVIRRVRLPAPAGQVAYDRSGSRLAVLTAGQILVIDPSTGAVRARGPHLTALTRPVFDPVAPVVALAGPRGVTLWNSGTGRVRRLALPAGIAPGATALAFSPDGRRLAVADQALTSAQPGLVLLDVASGRVLAQEKTPSFDVMFAPDGRELAVAEIDPVKGIGAIVIRGADKLERRRTIARLPAVQPTAVAFDSTGARVAYGGADGTAGLVSAATGASIVRYLGQTAAVTQAAFSPDGRLVATGSADGTVRVWRATGIELGQAKAAPPGTIGDLEPLASGFVALELGAHGPIVHTVSADGRAAAPPLQLWPTTNIDAAFLSGDGRLAGLIVKSPPSKAPVQIWDIAKRRVVATVPASTAPEGNPPLFSPDGRAIAMAKTISHKRVFVLVDVRSGGNRVLGDTACAAGWRGYAFNHSGTLVAAGSFCGQVHVWDVASGKPVGRPLDIGGELAGVAFDRTGQRIAIGSWNSTITVADVSSGRVVAVLTDNAGGVTGLAYSPNGRYLASSSLDQAVRIWDARTLKLVRVLKLQRDDLGGVAFTRDSRRLLSGNGVVRTWEACPACEDAGALLALARTRVTRALTPQERRTFSAG